MRLQRRLESADVAELSTLMLGDAAIPVKDVRSAMPLLRLEGELANRVGLALSIARHSATVVVPNAGPQSCKLTSSSRNLALPQLASEIWNRQADLF